jgi:hypothetical protein
MTLRGPNLLKAILTVAVLVLATVACGGSKKTVTPQVASGPASSLYPVSQREVAGRYIEAWIADHPHYNGVVFHVRRNLGAKRWLAQLKFQGQTWCVQFRTDRWSHKKPLLGRVRCV